MTPSIAFLLGVLAGIIVTVSVAALALWVDDGYRW